MLKPYKLSILLAGLAMVFLTACGEKEGGKAEMADPVRKLTTDYIRAVTEGDTGFVLDHIIELDTIKDPQEKELKAGKISGLLEKAKNEADGKGGVSKIEADPAIYTEDGQHALVHASVCYRQVEKCDDLKVYLQKNAGEQWKVRFK